MIATLVGRVRDRVRRLAFEVAYEVRWRAKNAVSRRRFRAQLPSLSDVQRRLVHDLCVLGIAFAKYDELGVDPKQWQRLCRSSHEFRHSQKVAHAIQSFAAAADRPPGSDAYLVKRYPEGATFSVNDALVQFGVASPVLDVVNSYLGLRSKLIYMDLWHSIPVDIGRRIGSQRWHRDPEDRRMIKIYLYLSHVHEGAGPLEYVPGSPTTGPGKYHRLWPWTPRGARYPSEEIFDRHVPASDRMLCTGEPGTIIFCDTNGFHRGGIATTGIRLVATWTFVTPGTMPLVAQRRFHLADFDTLQDTLSPAARDALT